MSWISLPESVASPSDSGAPNSADPSAMLRTTPTRRAYSKPECTTASLTKLQSGMMLRRSTVHRGAGWWILLLVASLVRTFQSPARVKASKDPAPVFGERCGASLGKFDLASCSLKTYQLSLLGDSTESLRILPRSGSMRSGIVFPHRPLAPLTAGTGSGSSVMPWATPCASDAGGRGYSTTQGRSLVREAKFNPLPTPKASDGDGRGGQAKRMEGRRRNLIDAASKWPTIRAANADKGGRGDLIQAVRGNSNPHFKAPTPSANDWKGSSKAGQRRGQLTDPAMGVVPAGGQLNPTWVEWLQGFPLGWTEEK